jgi:hypothetical protein
MRREAAEKVGTDPAGLGGNARRARNPGVRRDSVILAEKSGSGSARTALSGIRESSRSLANDMVVSVAPTA